MNLLSIKDGKEENVVDQLLEMKYNHLLDLDESELCILGGRLKAARREKGHTQYLIAEVIECSVGHLSAIENGKVMPSGRELVAFCRIYDLDFAYLFNGIISSQSIQAERENYYFTKLGTPSMECRTWMKKYLSDLLSVL